MIYFWSILAAWLMVLELLGILMAIHAVWTARTSQGAIAWGFALLTLPFISVPLYAIFGRSRFLGIVSLRRAQDSKLAEIVDHISPQATRFHVPVQPQFGNARVLEELAYLPFIKGNDTKLLIDGEATFAAMFAAIDRAQQYVLAEFFIVHDDQLGREFQSHLLAAARRGCRVYLLYDDVGSQKMTRSYQRTLRDAGVRVSGMKTTKGWRNRFQLNFRNHRKIVVIDGYESFVGGLNIGDEYIHRSRRLTPWRDTHLKMEGPATLATQLAFAEDWHWATGEILKLSWEPRPAVDSDKTVFVLPSGPDDQYETCGLFFTHCINSARRRIWIASPYFVPDEAIIIALQLAGMRGVDVRILIPGLADKWWVKQAALSYVPKVASAAVQMFEFGAGFLHQKVVLIDDQVSVVGTANLDNRSFRLNFEISAVTIDASFASEVESMLERDFACSRAIDPQELARRGLFFQLTSRVARLFSPIM